ncbi:hypothetical protein DFR52_10789 [Hoeflea marina]|uniref:Protease inhibitor Inh n=1 Tax=Hoeflea marina TaxID=274592 RepID=A0A317PCM5_9HYPH|nr:hypothetical protein [Hoeflea marina]PWV97177.1 hypothetical protein DFR52_10789 [Hoeflea marina]
MRGIILTALMSSGLLAGAVWLAPEGRDVDGDLIVGSIGRAADAAAGVEMMMASNAESGEICLLERAHDASSPLDLLSPGSDCDAVWPGLGGAQRWRLTAGGGIDLIERNGRPVLTLARPDGAAFRGTGSGQSVVTLTILE